jgi:hypothetical protein
MNTRWVSRDERRVKRARQSTESIGVYLLLLILAYFALTAWGVIA